MPEIEVPTCPPVEEASEICTVCGEEGCDCTDCAGCEAMVRSVCATCLECPTCCNCYHCSECDDDVDPDEMGHRCDTCERCDDCCECRRCPTSGCNCVSRNGCGDNDVFICSRCDRCECCCCECSSCSNCGDRVDDTCSNCNNCEGCCECGHCDSCGDAHDSDDICSTCSRCDDCCGCVTCSNCGDRVRDFECGDCERCEDCGCGCDDDEGEDVPTEDQINATTTFEYGRENSSAYCETCETWSCTCRFCWDTSDPTVRPSVRHTYKDRNSTCSECHTCKEHCRASLTCPKCEAAGEMVKWHKLCESCGECENHCDCVHCQADHKRIRRQDRCDRCECCLLHCRCPKCPKCQQKGKICKWCMCCKECCESEESECACGLPGSHHDGYFGLVPIPQPNTNGPPTFYIPNNLLGFRKNPLSRALGIELETNTYHNMGKLKRTYLATQKWSMTVKPDGSIGTFPQGMEFNLAPAAGDMLVEQVNDLCEGLAFAGCNPNQRCGIHVHVDCRDILADDLKRIIDVYAVVERALFCLCHPYRLDYQYCVVCGPNYKNYGNTGREVRLKLAQEFFNRQRIIENAKGLTGQRKHEVLQEYGNDFKRHRDTGSSRVSRYRALNLVSYFKRRTIEFRHFHSTIDPVEITNWALTVGNVIDRANRMTARQVAMLPSNSRKALYSLLPEHLHEWVKEQWNRMDKIVTDDPYGEGDRRKRLWLQHWGIE